MQMTLSTPVFLCMPSKQLLHGNGKFYLHTSSTFNEKKKNYYLFRQTEVIKKKEQEQIIRQISIQPRCLRNDKN